MKNRFFLLLIILLCSLNIAVVADARDDVKKIGNKSLVYIEGIAATGERWIGSGFFITSSIVATNYHVIRKADVVIGVDHRSGRHFNFEGATMIDTSSDLAFLKVPASFQGIPLSGGGKVNKGQTVYAVGYPGGKYKFKKGKVIDTKGFRACEYTEFQISRNTIRSGNSGGPILNQKGRAVGVAVAGIELSIIKSIFGNISFNLAGYAVHIHILDNWGRPTSIKHHFPIYEEWASACTLQRSGHNLLNHGYYSGAISAYDSAIAQDPNIIEAYVGRALSKYLLGGWSIDSVIADLDTALGNRPDRTLRNTIQRMRNFFRQ